MTWMLRTSLEEEEAARQAPWGVRSAESRGRDMPESPDPWRTEFQRDRDRIIHSAAFRKLEYKTQVYVTNEGDYFRTRLTHTLEVAQIARTLARNLGVNPDLTEAIALAHDLGHTPFGHSGERVLNELMCDQGGYEHNAQSLRVVELLEDRFHDRPGLNLSWEVREGIAVHSKHRQNPDIARYIDADAMHPSLEAQIVDLADEIAYNNHDLDDALSMGLLTEAQLTEVDWLWEIWSEAVGRLPEPERAKYGKFRALGGFMEAMVRDLMTTTMSAVEAAGVNSVDDVRRAPERIASFSTVMRANQDELRGFLMANVYRHPTTLRMQNRATRFFRQLFELYLAQPELLPIEHQGRIEEFGLRRVLVDYLSGMTDRRCLDDYRHHFETTMNWSL